MVEDLTRNIPPTLHGDIENWIVKSPSMPLHKGVDTIIKGGRGGLVKMARKAREIFTLL